MTTNTPVTKLIDKHLSPVFVQIDDFGGGLTVVWSIISDVQIDTKPIVSKAIDYVLKNEASDFDTVTLQKIAGWITESLRREYDSYKPGCVEGIGVIVTKDGVSAASLYGDHMNHAMCRDEFYYNALLLSIAHRQKPAINCNFTIRKYNIVAGWPLWIAVSDSKLKVSDEEIIEIVQRHDLENSYESINAALDTISFRLCLDEQKHAIFCYVDKAWLVRIRHLDPYEVQILMNLLMVSPHV